MNRIKEIVPLQGLNRRRTNIAPGCIRRSWIAISFVSILLGCSAAQSSFAARQPANHTVYLLKQKSKVFGDQTVYVSPTALRLDMHRLNCSIVTRQPGLKFQMFSPSKKLFYEKDIDKWHANFSAPDKFEKKCKAQNVGWRVVGSKNICGITCGEYIIGRLKGSHDPGTRHMPKDPAKRRYYLADSMPISHEASELLAKMCKISALSKVPLRVRVWDSHKGEHYNQLDTFGCEKKTVPDSFFSVPPKYKKTSNEFDVFIAFGDAADPVTGIEDILFRSNPGMNRPSE